MTETILQEAQRSVYVAGPMRGYPAYNFPAFDAAAERFRAAGWRVISPAELDRSIGFDENRDTLDTFDLGAAIDRDVAAIRSLSPNAGDAVAMLPGWERSKGARAEKALAEWMGLAILDAVTMCLLDEVAK